MIFRRPTSYSITLKRAHTLLNLPIYSNNKTSIRNNKNVPSRDQIQQAFRAAAKRYHPDLQTQKTTSHSSASNTTTFRECHEARELLLDYYIHKNKFINLCERYTYL